MNEEYNGWTNYETWVTKLWMENDESFYRTVIIGLEKVISSAEEVFDYDGDFDTFGDDESKWLDAEIITRVAGYLEEIVDIITEDSISKDCQYSSIGLASDLMTRSKQKIDFREIAKSFVEEAKLEEKHNEND